jgi:hypothetical protein
LHCKLAIWQALLDADQERCASCLLAQRDLGDVCQQEAYAFGGLNQTPKIDKLGSSGI